LLERRERERGKERIVEKRNRERGKGEREREEERVNKIIHIMGNYTRRTRGVKLLF
jgi:hypothetical protein